MCANDLLEKTAIGSPSVHWLCVKEEKIKYIRII